MKTLQQKFVRVMSKKAVLDRFSANRNTTKKLNFLTSWVWIQKEDTDEEAVEYIAVADLKDVIGEKELRKTECEIVTGLYPAKEMYRL